MVRLDGVGDMILSGPFLRTLRKNMPEAWITLVVNPQVSNLVELCPYVNEVLTYDWRVGGPWGPLRRHSRALWLARRRLWRRDLDLAVVPRWDDDYYHAAFLAYFSAAPRRVGYSEAATERKQALNRGWDQLYTDVLLDTGVKHEVERTLAMIRLLGGAVDTANLEVWLDPDDEAFARQVIASHGMHPNRPLIAIGPGKRDPKRRWPLSRFIKLGESLVQDYEARLLVLGDPTEADLGQALQRHFGHMLVNLVGKTTLRQACALLKHCTLYVGNDYGPKHLAAAVSVPVVEINAHPLGASPAHPDSPTHFSPWGVSHCVLQPERPRPPCSGGCEAPDPHCILEITVDQVKEAVFRLLRETARPVGAPSFPRREPGHPR